MDKKLLSKAYKAGCRGLIFGLESASQNVLNHMKKNIIISTVEDVIINCYDVVIDVGCFFIIGYVNETEKDFENTLQFVKKNYKYIKTIYSSSGLHILKGSELYEEAEKYQIILPEFSPDGEWCTADRSNTSKIRNERLKRFNDLISELYSKKEAV